MISGCNIPETAVAPDTPFTYISQEESGIDFSNKFNISDSINILNYIYSFNGSGVGVGDINNDGLDDVFFAGNQVSSKLYLNQGNFKFKDITKSANVSTSSWCTGVSMVDINKDGFLDIYISVAGSPNPEERANLLFINNQDETFTEAAKKYGIADTSYTTHAAFFDYDHDGNLDLYLLNHANDRASLNTPLPKKVKGEGASNDRLYKNNGPGTPFTDVSLEAGITIEGYGLGIAVSDINGDNWPDLYIANDFISNDILYLNNQDGTFSNHIADMIQEQTYNSMGNDVSDFNNDGLADIVVVDMLPSDPVREKNMAGSMTQDKFNAILAMDYESQFMRNTLQLNQGNNDFIEIGRYSGIHRTDWSWAPLLIDLDNDGWKDLFITNGYFKDITDKDFIDYNNNLSMFKDKVTVNKETLQRIEELEGIKLSNFSFKNNKDLTFSNQTNEWGLSRESYSNGAAFSDLDNDGDLDLIVNNINDPAFVIRNNSSTTGNFIQVVLKDTVNHQSIGAKVKMTSESGNQYAENSRYRGFMSTMTDKIHFGLGNDTIVNSLEVIWPDGSTNSLSNLKANQVVVVHRSQGSDGERKNTNKLISKNGILEEVTSLGIEYSHQIYNFNDFRDQPLLPYRLSAKGPALATGDFDNNGLEDLYVGGDMKNPGVAFFQKTDGTFHKENLKETEGREITDAAIFDVNGDGFQDLYLTSGGIGYSANHEKYQDLLYFGSGNFNLILTKEVLPDLRTSTATVAPGDIDNDGDFDLFIGGYAEARNFPAPPNSYFLRNENGKYFDATEDVSSELVSPGMVRDAVWTDYNKDGRDDLVVVGEWMPVMIFQNDDGVLINSTKSLGLEDLTGWWQSITAGDFDKDGDIDLIAGNIGLNSRYKASPDEPVRLYAPDFNEDGIYDPIMTYFINGKETIHPSRDIFLSRLPFFKKEFPSHLSFAKVSIEDIIPKGQLSSVYKLESKNFNSLLLINEDLKSFQPDTLSGKVQLLSGNDISIHNEGSNRPLFFIGGGFNQATYEGTGFGASGLLPVVYNLKKGINTNEYPFLPFEGDVSDMEFLSKDGNTFLIIGITDGEMKIFKLNNNLISSGE